MPPKKPRVIVAGQIPPPVGGQNIMIQKAVTQFAQSDRCESAHLPFFFTPDVKSFRRSSLSKVLELIKVIGRLFRIRMTGPIDILLYPTGGPQKVPMIRDMFLLPAVLLLSRRVILHFHAAGIADRLKKNPGSALNRVVSYLYGKAFAAVVMTNFNRRDPEAVGINRILVVPHRIDDDFDPALVCRDDRSALRLLYMGHLCADKGTPELLQAFALVRRDHPELELDLVGECMPPFTQLILEQLIEKLQIRRHVRLLGVLTGRAKAETFGRADLFIFPTVAPYESFGLVLVEAMAWKLPILATRWRGNLDVLTPRAGAVCFTISPSLAENMRVALEQAIRQRSDWAEWGRTNRLIFEQRYRENETREWLAESVLSLVTTDV